MSDQTGQVVARIGLRLGNNHLNLRIPVSSGPVCTLELLPVFQRLADDFTRIAADEAREEGRSISCKAGCGTCCRQLVPLGAIEARHVAALVTSLPEPRRLQVQARFAEARALLARLNLLDNLLSLGKLSDPELLKTGHDYLDAGIPCPFLENESCSVHPARPVVCREFLVTSPAANCTRPTPENIQRVRLAAKAWVALARIDEDPAAERITLIPLILAPEWAQANPDRHPPRPGPEILRQFFAKFTDCEIPPFGLR